MVVQVPSIAEDPDKWGPILKKICWYCVLAPNSSDQVQSAPSTPAPPPPHCPAACQVAKTTHYAKQSCACWQQHLTGSHISLQPHPNLAQLCCKASAQISCTAVMLESESFPQPPPALIYVLVARLCQVTLLEGTAADKKLLELPQYKELLTTFTKQEVPHPHPHPLCTPAKCGLALGLFMLGMSTEAEC